MPLIDTAFVKQFGSNVDFLVQQKGSRLRNAVRMETGVVGEEAFFDQIGETAAVKRTTRHADTPLVQTDHQRRRVSMFDFEWADLVDHQDKLKTLIDPESNYALNAAWAMGRAIDDEIITAAFGDAATGKTGSTTTSFPAGNIVPVGATGLTVAKLLEAKEILDQADVDPEEERFCAVTADQITDLLNETEVTSADFNTVRALASGQIDTFLGFKFIMVNRLTTNASSERQVIVWAKSGLLLAVARDIQARIEERADKSFANQVYLSMGIGSTRMQEEKVVQIPCVE